MPNILCIETATHQCSVALVSDTGMEALERFDPKGYIHGESLHPMMDELIEASELDWHDLDAIAVSLGPGSYTGLRIGASAAKGLAFALDLPCVGIPTLHHMAAGMAKKAPQMGAFVPMIDARRMEVYTSVFSGSSSAWGENEVIALPLDETSYQEVKAQALFFGDGAVKAAEILQLPVVDSIANIHEGCIVSGIEASARDMGDLALKLFRDGEFLDLAYFEPYYHKDFIAGKPKQLFAKKK